MTAQSTIVGPDGTPSPTPHRAGCRCTRCDNAPRDCPHPGCDRVGAKAPRGVGPLASHFTWSHGGRTRGLTRVVVPNGVGWLTGVFRSPHRLAALHLETFPQFSKWLSEAWKIRPKRNRRTARNAMRGHLAAARELAQRDPGARVEISTTRPAVPATLAAVMYAVALEADVSVGVITTVLLAYGVEHLAKELRATGYAPQPRLPSA